MNEPSPKPPNKYCTFCDAADLLRKGQLKSLVTDLGNSIFSVSVIRPNSKGHCSLHTKQHRKNIREVTPQE